MRKLLSAVMAASFIIMLWSANATAEDVPDCCKKQQACRKDGKACCPKQQ